MTMQLKNLDRKKSDELIAIQQQAEALRNRYQARHAEAT